MEELVDVFTIDGRRTCETLPKEEAIKQGKLIKAFQIWILNDKNEVLLEIRAKEKLYDAEMLDLCSGHVQSKELEIEAVKREIIEELGPNAIKEEEFYQIEKIGTEHCDFRRYGRDGNYLVPWYILRLKRTIPEEDFLLQQEEVASVEWQEYEKVKQMIIQGKNNIRIPYLPETKRLFEKLDTIIYEREPER